MNGLTSTIHLRPTRLSSVMGAEVLPKGGFTVAYSIQDSVLNDGKLLVDVAFSRCDHADNFNRKMGNQIAVGRLNCTGHKPRFRNTLDLTEALQNFCRKEETLVYPIFLKKGDTVYVNEKQFPFNRFIAEGFTSNTVVQFEEGFMMMGGQISLGQFQDSGHSNFLLIYEQKGFSLDQLFGAMRPEAQQPQADQAAEQHSMALYVDSVMDSGRQIG